MDNKVFIFVTGRYLPQPSATGLCVATIAQELALGGHDVHVVCISDTSGEEECIGQVKVHNILLPLLYRRTNKKFIKWLQRLYSLIRSCIYFHLYPFRSWQITYKYIKKVEPLIDGTQKLILISSFVPLEAEVAVMRLRKKYPGIKTIFYSTDTLSNEQGNGGILPPSLREKKGYKWECEIFDCFDHSIIMECHKDHYSTSKYSAYTNKMSIANFPFLIKTDQNQLKQGPVLLFTYAGSLLKQLRRPEYLCETLIKLREFIEFESIFIGGGDCSDILEKYVRDSNGSIKYIGMQTHEKVKEYLAKTDILLSIGNKNSPMVPSKIYEYMATGKPIIHCYSCDNDPCIATLNKYGNALLLNENETVDIKEIVEFIHNIKIIPFDVVSNYFVSSTPQYTACLIAESVQVN